ncbi:MAG: hypothetical protein QXL86_03805 [Candidatus Aenigmatarchaeota archaeon]
MKEAEWKFWVLDTEHPQRFVSVVADSKGNPHIVYFDEKNRGGLRYFTSKSSGISLIDDIIYYFKGREWVQEVVDRRPNVGMFISMAIDSKDNLHVSYQDSTLGRERLLYAFFDGSWKIEEVDKAEESGINVGMYSSISLLEDKPIIFYHTEQGRKFGYAIKTNLGWEKKELERGVGWLTSSDSCNKKTFVAYRERDERGILFGILKDGKYESKRLGVNTSSGISLKTLNCEAYIAYFDDSKSEVRFGKAEDFNPVKVGEGKLSRLSLATSSQGFHIVYHFYEKGLRYAFSKDGLNWGVKILDPGRRDGEYNSIAVDKKGNIHIAYLNETALKYAEFNVSSVEAVKNLVVFMFFLFLILGFVFAILSISKKK